MLDPALMRLQYEIFNKSLAEIAAESRLPLSLVTREAEKHCWKQLWPDPPKIVEDTQEPYDSVLLTDDERAELLALESEQYIENARKRLRVYTLAKDILLASKYLELEHKLIDTAIDMLEDFEGGPQGVKQLSALYKDLTSGTNLSNLAKAAIGMDDDGMPQVIIRDLSGSNAR